MAAVRGYPKKASGVSFFHDIPDAFFIYKVALETILEKKAPCTTEGHSTPASTRPRNTKVASRTREKSRKPVLNFRA